jgi:hypothetical protein
MCAQQNYDSNYDSRADSASQLGAISVPITGSDADADGTFANNG